MPRKASLTRLEERGEGVTEEQLTFESVLPDDADVRDAAIKWVLDYLSRRRVTYTYLEDVEDWLNSTYYDVADVNILSERLKGWVRLLVAEHNNLVSESA